MAFPPFLGGAGPDHGQQQVLLLPVGLLVHTEHLEDVVAGSHRLGKLDLRELGLGEPGALCRLGDGHVPGCAQAAQPLAEFPPHRGGVACRFGHDRLLPGRSQCAASRARCRPVSSNIRQIVLRVFLRMTGGIFLIWLR